MKRRRDYQKKDFRNPFLPKKLKGKHLGLKILFSCFFVFLLFYGAGKYFKIKNIESNQDPDVETKEKGYAVAWVIGPKKYYLDKQGMVVKEETAADLVIEPGKEGTEIIRPKSGMENFPVV